MKYVIYYDNMDISELWQQKLMDINKHRMLGIISPKLPIIGNLSVFENIMLGASYHFNISKSEADKLIRHDLEKYGFDVEKILSQRPNQLNDYKNLVVKYLQVKYINPEWIVFLSPRRMISAEFEDRFHDFLHCVDSENSVIIDHISNSRIYSDLHNLEEKDFDQWLAEDLKT